MADRLVDYEAAARFLGVDRTRVSNYANMGLLERHRVRDSYGRLRVMFSEDDLLAFDQRYPVGPNGLRSLGKVTRPSPNIREDRLANGTVRYRVQLYVNGTSYNRTFKTLQGAERHRDRYLEQMQHAGSEQHEQKQKPGFWRRIINKLNTEPWKAVGNG